MLKKIILLALLSGLCQASTVDDRTKAFKDYKNAQKLFTKACDGGDAVGCYNLGLMYFNGQGVKQSKSLALKYFAVSCDMKYENACYNYTVLKKKK
jgi:hypothetical protein